MDMDFIDDFNSAYAEREGEGTPPPPPPPAAPSTPAVSGTTPSGIAVEVVSVTPPAASSPTPTSPSGTTSAVGSTNTPPATPSEVAVVGSTPVVETGTNPGENSDPEPEPPVVTGAPRVNNSRPPIRQITPTNHVITHELEYFNMLFADDFDVSKLYNVGLLSNFGFNTNEIQQIIFLMSAAIKANVDPKTVSLRGLGSILSVNKLERFIKGGRLELNVIPNSKNSVMVASFIKDGSSERFDIPVCLLPKGLSGKYVGKFKLENKPRKHRGIFLPLEEVRRRHP